MYVEYNMECGPISSDLSSAEMEKIFLETFGPKLLTRKFEYCGKCRWFRQTESSFKHLFYLYPFRPGADYYPHGAISFDFVPRIEAGKVKIRPDAKYARVHLGIVHYRLASDRCISRQRFSAKQKCLELAEPVVEHVTSSLEKLNGPEDLIAIFQRKKGEDGPGFYSYPEMALSYAFTLAKLGRKAEAQTELAQTLQSRFFPQEIHNELQTHLNSIIDGAS